MTINALRQEDFHYESLGLGQEIYVADFVDIFEKYEDFTFMVGEQESVYFLGDNGCQKYDLIEVQQDENGTCGYLYKVDEKVSAYDKFILLTLHQDDD